MRFVICTHFPGQPVKGVHINVSGLFSVHLRYERMLQICHKDERGLFHTNCFGKFVFGHEFFFQDDFFNRATAFVRFFYNLSALVVADVWC